jgi:hypothetical protein
VNIRTAITTGACALVVLAAGTACSGHASNPAKPRATSAPTPSLPAAAVATFLQDLHDSASSDTDDQLLTPGKTPDSKLIAAGLDACAGLRHQQPGEALSLLEGKGWSKYDASSIVLGAAHSHLCGLPAGVTPRPASSTPSTAIGKYLMMLRSGSKGTEMGGPIMAASDARLVELGQHICAELRNNETPNQVDKELEQSWSQPNALVLMLAAGGPTWSLCPDQGDTVQAYIHSVNG